MNRIVKKTSYKILPQVTKKTIVALEAKVKRLHVERGDILVFPENYKSQATVVMEAIHRVIGDIEVILVFGDVTKLSKKDLTKILKTKK